MPRACPVEAHASSYTRRPIHTHFPPASPAAGDAGEGGVGPACVARNRTIRWTSQRDS
jgi:hypothetical protein